MKGTALSMIEEVTRDLQIGRIEEYRASEDSWNIYMLHDYGPFQRGAVGTFTTEFIEGKEGIFIDDDMDYLYEERSVLKCTECNRKEPLYDEKANEHYCPVCESE